MEQKQKAVAISIIVPALNEEGNIETLVERIDQALSRAGIIYELIIIDDYSIDNTYKKAEMVAQYYPVRVFRKQGKQGKAYALLEGFARARYEYSAFIDADLQYPPEAIPEMIEKIEAGADVIVSKRVTNETKPLRKFLHWGFSFFFTKMLHGFDFDVQSGLKVFRTQVIKEIKVNPSGWTFDLEFLLKARNYGYQISNVDINFDDRVSGESKISIRHQILEIGLNALKLKFRKKSPLIISPENGDDMMGAGIAHRRNRFITHTTLERNISAFSTVVPWQKYTFLAFGLSLLCGFLFWPIATGILIVSTLSIFYFSDMFFNLFLVLRSMKQPPEISFNIDELKALNDEELPVYSILCPLYKEANVLEQFLANIDRLNWPKGKLDVMLLLEEDDHETIQAAQEADTPDYVRIIVVPHSMPKTKPKACNYGLCLARGKYVVIYDAEDSPDPWQLKKAYLGFKNSPQSIRCLQAKLNYYNSKQNILTRLFTSEYSLWFDVILPGLQTINTSIPLGGTSNHFRTNDLLELEGWDPFNVTEDCDLGIRIFKRGYQTAIIDSVTLEEANSRIRNWLRQRSRWIKGYMQTYLVHMREPVKFVRENGIHAFIFQLVVGGKVLVMIINPLLWMLTISYFVFNQYLGDTIQAIYPGVVFYIAIVSGIFGNFLYIYYYMIGCARREEWSLIKYVFLIPFYWVLVSIAAIKAAYQLLVKPHYWEKTQHGLHIQGAPAPRVKEEVVAEPVAQPVFTTLKNKLISITKTEEGSFIYAIMLANFINLVFNAYLGRVLNFENLGLIVFVNTLWYLAMIFITAFATTVNHRVAYLTASNSEGAGAAFLSVMRKKALQIVIYFTAGWLLVAPFMTGFFNLNSFLVLILIAPIFPFGIILYSNFGYLKGTLNFRIAAKILIFEALSKLLIAFALVNFGLKELIYLVIPATVVLTGLYSIKAYKKVSPGVIKKENYRFPKRFFSNTIVANLSAIAFLSLDIVLVKHYLSPVIAGEYALLSLIGKMIYFGGSIPNQFMMTYVSRYEGLKKESKQIFLRIFIVTTTLVIAGIIVLGFFGSRVTPLFFGEKIFAIAPYLPIYTIAIALFTLTSVIVSYHLAKKQFNYPLTAFFFSLIMSLGIVFFHSSISAIVSVILVSSILAFLSISTLHLLGDNAKVIARNLKDLTGIFFGRLPQGNIAVKEIKRILVFNWRDTRHIYAGGAEFYIQEIAERLAKQGVKVTIFCGNDGFSPRSELLNDVEIIRRGGFYMVYVWAFLYYLFRFRGRYDAIVDCENGIPFFTPLYAREPVFCLLFHIHQEVFRKSLKKPLAKLAMFLERDIMPIVYRNIPFITISKSSKKDMRSLGLGKAGISVVNPGVDLKKLIPGNKFSTPTALYLGRLKEYKSIDLLIQAFRKVVDIMPEARLLIAGNGEEDGYLKSLANDLNLNSNVKFLGRVNEEDKLRLFQQAWTMVNPSYMEGWGITTIEANACGTPVIASDVPGLRDSVNNSLSGFLVKYGDIDGLARRIIDIFKSDDKRKEMSYHAIQWAQNFDWQYSSLRFYAVIDYSYNDQEPKVGWQLKHLRKSA
jgi:cellulose synthase/poly-beta-1,6-N-acetylglucosamine synthase-like glycosyltransferase/glycosyltransferase involved in cell wall biosynthesis/O-antigen/teichoic acid export membrane protein